MAIWSVPQISTAASGLAAFDMRPLGYSETAAREFLAALNEQGRDFYLNIQHRIDLVFIGLLALTLGIAIYFLFPTAPGIVNAMLILLPFMAALFDYVENSRVAVLLTSNLESITAQQIAAASQATVLKFGFIAVSMGIILVGLGFKFNKPGREIT
ncbi:MAG: hypothetical protein V3V25_01835 [Paracoccaceae bacterium]